jgi:cytosine deaminase
MITVQEAVALAAERALAARAQGTFGVGAVLLDDQGQVLASVQNDVVRDGVVYDPTAHGERQLVDWYWAERRAGRALPPPEVCTIVSSLDPCVMCAGALLTSGFRVVVAAHDPVAGVNHDRRFHFTALPEALRPRARARFHYPRVEGASEFARPASGPALAAPFSTTHIEEATQALCTLVFQATSRQVQALLHAGLPPSSLADPAGLPEDHPVRTALREAYPQALAYRCRPAMPDAGLAPFLIQAMRADLELGGQGEAVALLDSFGNLLLCTHGQRGSSPSATAFMECTRRYAHMRYRLLAAVPASQRDEMRSYLPHPKDCTFVFARGPGVDAHSLMDLGAYGSTLEGPVPEGHPGHFQYVLPTIAPADLRAMCARLPPLYANQIRIAPVQVASTELVDQLARGFPQARP